MNQEKMFYKIYSQESVGVQGTTNIKEKKINPKWAKDEQAFMRRNNSNG